MQFPQPIEQMEYMRCINCNNKLNIKSQYCSNCGSSNEAWQEENNEAKGFGLSKLLLLAIVLAVICGFYWVNKLKLDISIPFISKPKLSVSINSVQLNALMCQYNEKCVVVQSRDDDEIEIRKIVINNEYIATKSITRTDFFGSSIFGTAKFESASMKIGDAFYFPISGFCKEESENNECEQTNNVVKFSVETNKGTYTGEF